MVGNHSQSEKADWSLTATPTGGAGTKVGLSYPVVFSGNAIAQRIIATLGISGLALPRVHIDGVVWHLDVGSSHPGAVVGPKGWAVRPLKRYASWVQNVGKAEGSLTATPTGGAGTKVGLSDPVVFSGNAIAQRIIATLGITGLSLPRVHIDGVVWHLDVGSSHPGAVVGPKGWAVRPLKRYASWVHNVVRQFGPYPAWA